jgi:nucleotide-binding universal stress UspA family protein
MRRETFNTLVVGADGRSGGDDAACLARALAGPSTTIALVHVAVGGGSHDDARRLLHAARTRCSGPCLTVLRTADDVGSGLRSAARDLSADAIVVGAPAARSASATAADLPAILHHAPCAVAVAPRGEAGRGRTLEHVGVAYRDTPSGHAALALARDLAAAHHGDVTAMTVVPLLPTPWLGPTIAGAQGAAQLGGEVALVAGDHLDGLADVHGVVAEGDPAAQLTRFSRTVDLLIVGTRGHGALRRLLVGSTAEVLLTASACPVLVVPGGAVGAPLQATGSTAESARLAPR